MLLLLFRSHERDIALIYMVNSMENIMQSRNAADPFAMLSNAISMCASSISVYRLTFAPFAAFHTLRCLYPIFCVNFISPAGSFFLASSQQSHDKSDHFQTHATLAVAKKVHEVSQRNHTKITGIIFECTGKLSHKHKHYYRSTGPCWCRQRLRYPHPIDKT